MQGDFWVTEILTWKIYADSQEEAKKIWEQYQETGEAPSANMKLKDYDIDPDWD